MMTRQIITYLRFTLLFLLLGIGQGSGLCQLGTPVHHPDEERFDVLVRQARSFLSQGMTFEALNNAEQALQLAMSEENNQGELKVLELMGDIYRKGDQSADAIPYYLKAIGIAESNSDSTLMIQLYEKTALSYEAEQVHSGALNYYQKILEVLPETARKEQLEIRSRLGSASYRSQNYSLAASIFANLLEEYPDKSEMKKSILRDMISTYDADLKYDSAAYFCKVLLEQLDPSEDQELRVETLNNLGYYETLLNNYAAAAKAYEEAMLEASGSSVSKTALAGMKSNTAVCYANMGNERKAISLFNEAIELLEQDQLTSELSRNENMLANLYFSLGDLFNASSFSRQSINSALEARDPWREAQAYLTYSKILREGNDPVNALSYYEKYLAIRDSIEFAKRLELQELENKRNLLEKQEKALQLSIQEDKVTALAIQQLILQNERIEQDREILLQQQNLNLLKQDSLRQSNIIKDQVVKAARQDQENMRLEQEKMMADMKAREAELESEESKRAEQAAKREAYLTNLEAEKAIADQKVFKRSLIGAGLLLILILINLITARRKNMLLARQKEEIQEKNTDLEQKNEEISTQRDEIEAQRNLVFEQKQAIEVYNGEIVKSIEYAKRLQAAALPAMSVLEENVPDQFVFFKPRDVVSGDFYWFAKVEGKLVATVADCTGHGVPGAFMSMMGMSFLRELVQKEYITHPGVILRRLRKEIINTMGQKGISGEQRDGMDMALVTYDPDQQKLEYAGAYNSLYLVRKKDLPAPMIGEHRLEANQENGSLFLYEVPADKMPIAHFERMDKFRNHEIEIYKSDIVYLFTDGFADQFGGPKGKKFMYKPFKRLLLENAGKSLDKQKSNLESFLEEWMGSIEQVDDICVMGLRF